MNHTDTCNRARQLDLQRSHPAEDCWNPLPLYIKPHYVVGKCLECLEAAEHGRVRMNEPARQVAPGLDARIVNRGVHTANDIAERAVEWRYKVEEDERISRAEEMRNERALEARRTMRRMAWAADWAAYRVAHAGEPLPKILDLTEEIQGNDALLHVEQPQPGERCFCWVDMDQPAYGEKEVLPRAMHCGHARHRKCISQALMGVRSCPVCSNMVNQEIVYADFVLKSSNDDPKYRWDEGQKKWFQVDGYVNFTTGHEGRNFFEPYGDGNRWGGERL